MKHFNKLWIMLAFVSILFACQPEEEDVDPSATIETQEVTLSRETNYGEDWVYFSFATGAEVTSVNDTNYQTDTTWDIAFNRYNVRTNGGSSGTGMAAAYDAGEVAFDSVEEALETGYTTDSTIQIVETISYTGPPTMMSSYGNTVFYGVIGLEGQPPNYIPNNHIYVVKTAEGNYAKIWIKGFYNAQGESGYVNFKYSYQTNGSTTLE